jgi:hypothetical protein
MQRETRKSQASRLRIKIGKLLDRATMTAMTTRSRRTHLAASLWIALIYASIPFVRRMRDAFATHWPAEFIAYGVITVVLGAAAATIVYLRLRRPKIGLADLLWLVGVAAVIVVWTRRLMGQPEEAVHFFEYGVLGFLLFRAFEKRVPDPTVYLAVTLTGFLVGTFDEFIQWLVPGRFWDFRDIVLNGGAVALVQIAIWRLVIRPPQAVGRSSVRLMCRLAAAEVLLLTVCMAATPQRLNRLADHIPLPHRLATGVDAICEYGHRHSVDDRTFFSSRLSLDELMRSDRDQAAVLSRELDASRGGGGLSRIDISPISEPFSYEIRVHLFARNRNLNRAGEYEPGSPEYRRRMTTAWRENLILESSFGKTLERSSYRWGRRRANDVEAAQDSEAFFVSRAGAHLITRISEGHLRAILLALLTVLVACDVLAVTRSRLGSPLG